MFYVKPPKKCKKFLSVICHQKCYQFIPRLANNFICKINCIAVVAFLLLAITDCTKNKVNIKEKKDEELISWLNARNNKVFNINDHLKLQAIKALAKRKNRHATPALGKMLNNTNPRLSKAALQALITLSDDNSVNYIIDYADGKKSALVREAIAAVKSIGGNKAKAWLFTLSTGHSDASVNYAAKKALEHLESN